MPCNAIYIWLPVYHTSLILFPLTLVASQALLLVPSNVPHLVMPMTSPCPFKLCYFIQTPSFKLFICGWKLCLDSRALLCIPDLQKMEWRTEFLRPPEQKTLTVTCLTLKEMTFLPKPLLPFLYFPWCSWSGSWLCFSHATTLPELSSFFIQILHLVHTYTLIEYLQCAMY